MTAACFEISTAHAPLLTSGASWHLASKCRATAEKEQYDTPDTKSDRQPMQRAANVFGAGYPSPKAENHQQHGKDCFSSRMFTAGQTFPGVSRMFKLVPVSDLIRLPVIT
jgi:hypothetical protein